VRDPHGFRPLCIGEIRPKVVNILVSFSLEQMLKICVTLTTQEVDKKPVYVLSSESCALHTVGAEFLRDIEPGEIIRIDKAGMHSSIGATLPPQKKVSPLSFPTDLLLSDIRTSCRQTSLCVFEYVYFSRPDSLLDRGKQLVHRVRQNLGRRLAQEHPALGADLGISPCLLVPQSVCLS